MQFCTKAIISTEELYFVFLFKAPTSSISHLRGIPLDAACTVIKKEEGGDFLNKTLSQYLVSNTVVCFEYFHAGLKTSLKVYSYVQVLYNL